MQENFPQPNQERNLALERQEAVKLHNDILKDQDNFSEFDKEWNIEKGINNNPQYNENLQKMNGLRRSVENIDKYRKLATSNEDLSPIETVNITDIEKLKQEKEKIDAEVEKKKKDIEKATYELNDLRKKLNLPETDDIPSLSDKKQKLENLILIQNELESKLTFEKQRAESQKQEESINRNIETRTSNENIQNISFSIGNLSRLLETRQSQGYNQIFNNQESFRMLASITLDTSNINDVKDYFLKINKIVEDTGSMNSTNEDPGSVYEVSLLLKQLSTNIQEMTSKIKNEEQKREVNTIASLLIENIDKTSSFISRKARAIEEFKNVRHS